MFAKKMICVLCFVFSSFAISSTNVPISKSSCLRVEAKIDLYKTYLNSGSYSKAKGRKYRTKINELKKKKAYCKKSHFPTSVKEK